MSILNRYFVYGLCVDSELQLPELEDSSLDPGVRGPDCVPISVVLRSIPLRANEALLPWFFVREDHSAIIRISGVATYRVGGGGAWIEVDVAQDADPAAVRLYLLGSAFGVLLHQRGEIPLHVSAVVVGGAVWAFTAPSGTGKSTLAAGLHLHAGLPLLADDVAVVRFSDVGEPPLVYPGPPVLKLDPVVLHSVPMPASMERLPEYCNSPKERIRIPGSYVDGPLPLAGVILLERDPEAREPGLVLSSINGVEAFRAAHEAVYRLSLAIEFVSQPALFARLGRLVNEVAFYRGRVSPPNHPEPGVRERSIRDLLQVLARARSEALGP